MFERLWIVPLVGAMAFAAAGIDTTQTIASQNTRLKYDTKGSNVLHIVAATPRDTAYPSDLAAPAFWFDASDTNGWTFAEEEGQLRVAKIPSKVGTRYASVDPEGGDFTMWTLKKPAYVTGAAAQGVAAAVDFGATGSKCGLVFDPVAYASETGNALSNVLENIGTIVTVLDARQGGGMLLGGGRGFINPDDTNSWYNGGAMFLRNEVNFAHVATTYDYWNSITRGSAHIDFQTAKLRRNGYAVGGDKYSTTIQFNGFGNAWEVLSVICVSNRVPATGIGLGDIRFNPSTSGGQRIAEMLIFDRVLSVADCQRLERWLYAKWMPTPQVGTNGRAQLGTLSVGDGDSWRPRGLPVEVNVPAGETFTLYRNQHGYGGYFKYSNEGGTALPALVKTGSGTFALADARNFQGIVRLQEGVLTLPQEPIPTALPEGAYLHFDASQTDSYETALGTDNRTYLDVWHNLITDSCYKDEPIVARAPSAQTRPEVLKDELGAGLNVIDFGAVGTVANNARHLIFATNTANVTIDKNLTVVALVGAQEGGGNLLGDAGYTKRQDQTSSAFITHIVGSDYSAEGTQAYLDGVPVDPGACGYVSAGYQVVALRASAAFSTKYIQRYNTYAGGGRLGEMAIYLRALTDDELRTASAYLMYKWLKRTAPGYAVPSTTTVPLVQNLSSEGGTIHVPDATTVTIGHLTGTKDLIKTGMGQLIVQDYALSNGAQVVVREGIVTKGTLPDVTAKCALAAAPSVHLDAEDSAHLDCRTDANGKAYVRTWRDANENNTAFMQPQNVLTHAPERVAASAAGPNGHAYLDFGAGFGVSNGGRSLHLSKALVNVRAAYAICKIHPGKEGTQAQIFSVSSLSYNDEWFSSMPSFLRQNDNLLGGNPVTSCVQCGKVFTNGVLCSYTAKAPTEEWFLLEFHPSGGTHVSSIGNDRGSMTTCGGFELGEWIVYERVLSEREKIATRNYLMQKWLGKTADELPDLPAKTDATPDYMGVYTLTGDVTAEYATDTTYTTLTGEGTLTKTGSGQLTFDDWSGFTGTVAVAAGTVKIAKRTPTATEKAGVRPQEGLIYWADAQQGVAAQADGDTTRVAEWTNAVDATWVAKPIREGKLAAYSPAPELNGEAIVNMGCNEQQGLVFYKDGVRTPLTEIRSVLWVFGSQASGGFLLGGGTNASNAAQHYNFHRGITNDYVYDASYAILNSHAQEEVRAADWRLNGVSIKPLSTGLSGAWDVISMNFQANAAYPVQAEGFAFDGRSLDGDNFEKRIGNQRLAEVLIYNRRLTADEITSAENYLRTKWCVGVQRTTAAHVTVDLAADSVLDCGGGLQYVATLMGPGRVTNGTIAAQHLIADGAASGAPVVAGTYKLLAGITIELKNVFAAGPFTKKFVIPAVTATTLDETEAALADITFTGEALAPRFYVRPVYDTTTGVLGAQIGVNRGSAFFFR